MNKKKEQKKEQKKEVSSDEIFTKEDFLKALKKASIKIKKPSREKEKKETSE